MRWTCSYHQSQATIPINIPTIVDESGVGGRGGKADQTFQRRFLTNCTTLSKATVRFSFSLPVFRRIQMGMRLIHKASIRCETKRIFPDNTDMIYDDQPSEIYRIVLSASSANAPDKLITKAATAEERKRGEEEAPVLKSTISRVTGLEKARTASMSASLKET